MKRVLTPEVEGAIFDWSLMELEGDEALAIIQLAFLSAEADPETGENEAYDSPPLVIDLDRLRRLRDDLIGLVRSLEMKAPRGTA